MACVICGKKQRIISVNTVKYPSQNTLPEVLSSVIGNKISSEDWNKGGKCICQVCNRQCEQYDDLTAKLQDLKEYLLQEYTKRIYRESQVLAAQDEEEQGGNIHDEDESATEGGKRTKDVSAPRGNEKEDIEPDDTAGDSEKRKEDGSEPSGKEKEDIEPDNTADDSEKSKKDGTEAGGIEDDDLDLDDEENGDLTEKRGSKKRNVTECEKDEKEEGMNKEGTEEDDTAGDNEKRKKDTAETSGNEKDDIKLEDKVRGDLAKRRGRKKKNVTNKEEKKRGDEEGKEKDIPDEEETGSVGENRQEYVSEASGNEKEDIEPESKDKGNLIKKRGRKKINVTDIESIGKDEEDTEKGDTVGDREKEKKDGTEPSGNEKDNIEPEDKDKDSLTKKRGRKKRKETDKGEKEGEVEEGKEKEDEMEIDGEGVDENEHKTNKKKEIKEGDADVSKASTEGETSENLAVVTVKLEMDDQDETSTRDDLSLSQENLPDRVVDHSTGDTIHVSKQVTRLTEKSNLIRLPDFEYQQWYSLDGYCYKLHTQNNRGQLLKCHKSSCVVSARVTKQGALVKIVGEHAHEPDRRVAERNKLYAKLKTRCMSDSTTLLITIYEEEAQRYPSGASYLPFPEVRMREWRAANDHTVVIHTDGSTLEESSKRFQCDVCNMGFNSSRLLTRHADKHNQSKTVGRMRLSGGRSFVASTPTVASMKIKNSMEKKRKRVLHKLQENGDESVVETETEEAEGDSCHVCQEKFATLKQLKHHIVSEHSGVMLMCVHCEIAFDTPLLLKRHKTSCRKCCDERIMQRHKKQLDDDLALQLATITGQEEDMMQDENDPNWDVTQADESTADEGDEEFSLSPKKKRIAASTKVNKCRVCSKSFPNQQQLTTHLYTHSSKKRYECSMCGSHFNKKAVLTRHMLSENHRGRIKINPPRISAELWDVSQGIRCAWAGGIKYECAVCSGTFSERIALLRHMRDEKHITDEIIVHEAQPPPRPADFWPRKRVKMTPDGGGHKVKPADVPRRGEVYPKVGGLDEPVEVGGLKFSSKREAMRAWYEFSGKKPLECAVCGAGFMTRVQLLAHMENTDHLCDSIVENVPVLEDLAGAETSPEENQIVPAQEMLQEDTVEIKQESGRVEIISQVIFTPEESHQKIEAPDEEKTAPESDQTYYIQTENVNGETVMVIQGDLDGSLHDNMQLFMDEDGNIVTQDDEGNTVQVMQVDLSRVQHLQHDNTDAGETDSQSDDVDRQHNYIQLRQDEAGAGLHVDGTGQEDDEPRPHEQDGHYSAEDQEEMEQEEETKVDPDETLSQADHDEQSIPDDKALVEVPSQEEEAAETKAVHTPRKSTRILDKSEKGRTLEEELAVVKRLRRARILK